MLTNMVSFQNVDNEVDGSQGDEEETMQFEVSDVVLDAARQAALEMIRDDESQRDFKCGQGQQLFRVSRSEEDFSYFDSFEVDDERIFIGFSR